MRKQRVIDGDNKPIVQSLERGFRILELLEEQGKELTPSQIARELDLKLTTVHGLMTTMLQWGILRRDPDTRKYSLGEKILELAEACLKTDILYRIAEEEMQILHDRFNETVCLGVLRGNRLITPLVIESNNVLKIDFKVAEDTDHFLLHCQARGKVILAYLRDEQQDAILNAISQLPRYTSNTIVDLDRLREELSRVRSQGYAETRGEHIPGISALAAPIFDYKGRVVASIGIYMSDLHIPTARWDKIRDEVIGTAANISQRLGHNFGGKAVNDRTPSNAKVHPNGY